MYANFGHLFRFYFNKINTKTITARKTPLETAQQGQFRTLADC